MTNAFSAQSVLKMSFLVSEVIEMVFTEMLYICVVHISWRCGSVSLVSVHMEWIIASYQLKALYDV